MQAFVNLVQAALTVFEGSRGEQTEIGPVVGTQYRP